MTDDLKRELVDRDGFWVPLAQHEAEVALHLEYESRGMAIIIGLKDKVDEYRNREAKLLARVARLEKALTSLSWILLDPEDNPVFDGSEGDHLVARQAFAALNDTGEKT